MIGGKRIGQGSYGCVYDPQLKCNGSNTRTPGIVAKLMHTDDAKEELRETTSINKIDPEYRWHLKPPEMCKVGMPDLETDELLSGCNQIDSYLYDDLEKFDRAKKHGVGMFDDPINVQKQNIMRQLNEYRILKQQHGGESVGGYIKKIELGSGYPDINVQKKNLSTFIDMFVASENLLLGLKEMYEHKICHFDIKSDNVVYHEKTNRFNFIDFGLTRSMSKIKDFPSIQRAYWVWPLDVWLCEPDVYAKHIKKGKNTTAIEMDVRKRMVSAYKYSYSQTIYDNDWWKSIY